MRPGCNSKKLNIIGLQLYTFTSYFLQQITTAKHLFLYKQGNVDNSFFCLFFLVCAFFPLMSNVWFFSRHPFMFPTHPIKLCISDPVLSVPYIFPALIEIHIDHTVLSGNTKKDTLFSVLHGLMVSLLKHCYLSYLCYSTMSHMSSHRIRCIGI